MRPTTAVIFAAGTGTRMLPITAAVQKELLPIGNRPIIDYTVADLITAGIKRIIFVIRPGQQGLKDYYLGNRNLEAVLTRLGKADAIATLKRIHAQATYEFVEQPDSVGYGTAAPLKAVLGLLIGQGPVVVSAGDDAIWRADGSSEMRDFISAFTSSGAQGALIGLPMTPAKLSQYGTIISEDKAGTNCLIEIAEKPKSGTITSTLANISKYILTEEVQQYVRNLVPNAKNGEYYLTDAMTVAAQDHRIMVYQSTGSYLDTGNPASWLAANNLVAEASQKAASPN